MSKQGKDKEPEVYISVDVETSGPIPGDYSMLTIGACVVGDEDKSFYRELKPISERAVPEALAVSGLSLSELAVRGEEPAIAMTALRDWVHQIRNEGLAVFVGFNACFDWSFVNWYFHRFVGENPFGIGGVDIKAFYMGHAGSAWRQTTSRQLPAAFQPSTKQNHHALDDARAQGEIFAKLLAASRARKQP